VPGPERLKAIDGSYEVDAYAHVLFPMADRATAIEAPRREVDRAAQIAVARAYHEQHDLPAAREDVRRLLRLLAIVERYAARLPPDDAAEVAADMAAGFKIPDASPVAGLLSQIIENINETRFLATEMRRLDMAPPPPSRSDPLARYFVEAMAEAHVARLSRPPPRSRIGPFVRLLAAAWRDLGFPQPPRDTPPEDWLGQKVEALPVLTTKISGQNR
jgi:hypothetical protein